MQETEAGIQDATHIHRHNKTEAIFALAHYLIGMLRYPYPYLLAYFQLQLLHQLYNKLKLIRNHIWHLIPLLSTSVSKWVKLWCCTDGCLRSWKLELFIFLFLFFIFELQTQFTIVDVAAHSRKAVMINSIYSLCLLWMLQTNFEYILKFFNWFCF